MQILQISLPSKKPWTIMCNFWNLFLFSKNVDYHIQFQEFSSFLQKHGLSYALSGISFPSPKTLSSICNFCKFRSLFQKRGLSKAISGFSFPFPKNMVYHMQFLKFLSLP